MNRIFSFIIALPMLLGGLPTAQAAEGALRVPAIVINGSPFRSPAEFTDGTAFVPVRSFVTQLDPECEVEYNDALARAEISLGERELVLSPGDVYITVNGRAVYAPGGIFAVDGVMYAPVRALAAACGAAVEWNADDFSATVTSVSSASPSGGYDGEDLYWLARIIEAESCIEPFTGKLAVGNVVLNRCESELYPDTVYEVVFDKRYGVQFSPVATGTVYNTPCEDCVAAAKLLLDGVRLSGDILYFINPLTASNSWVEDNCSLVMVIGAHSFYA